MPWSLQHPAPQQGGQRPGVAEVGAEVHADQHGEHRSGRRRPRPAGSSASTAGRLLMQVGQHRGEAAIAEQRGQAAALRQHGVADVAEAVVGDHRLDHDAEGQHEQAEQRLGRATSAAHGGPPAAQRPHAEHQRAGQRRPGRVHPGQRGDGEAGQRQAEHHQGEQPARRAVRRARRALGSARARSAREEAAEDQVLEPMATSHGRAISTREPGERQPGGGEGQQVGEVGDRQQQRRGVGQVRAGVDVRTGSAAGPGGGRDDDRGEQHDGGVQAEHRGDHGGDREDAGEQPRGSPRQARADRRRPRR